MFAPLVSTCLIEAQSSADFANNSRIPPLAANESKNRSAARS